jgi:hypothetical protein
MQLPPAPVPRGRTTTRAGGEDSPPPPPAGPHPFTSDGRIDVDLDAPGIDRDEAFELMVRAHEDCPYSRATRGNIDVSLSVGGASVERKAA